MHSARVYTDAGEVTQDNQGNEIRAKQVQDENRGWISTYFEDSTGYEMEPLRFYLNAGESTIRLTGVNEKFVIRKLAVQNKETTPTYEEYSKKNANATNNTEQGYIQKIQGEKAVRRSSPSLYATYDRTSSDTEYEDKDGKTEQGITDRQVLDMTGGTQWKVPNDWIEWVWKFLKKVTMLSESRDVGIYPWIHCKPFFIHRWRSSI